MGDASMIDKLIMLFNNYDIKDYRIVNHSIEEQSTLYKDDLITSNKYEEDHYLIMFNRGEEYGFFKTKCINDNFLLLIEYAIYHDFLSQGNLVIDNFYTTIDDKKQINNHFDLNNIVDETVSVLEFKEYLHKTTIINHCGLSYSDYNTEVYVEFIDKDNSHYISKVNEDSINLNDIRKKLSGVNSGYNEEKLFCKGTYLLTSPFLVYILHFLVACFNYINVKNCNTFITNESVGMQLFDESINIFSRSKKDIALDYEGNIIGTVALIIKGKINSFYGSIEDLDNPNVHPSCFYDYFLKREKLYTPVFVMQSNCIQKCNYKYIVLGANFQKTQFDYLTGEITIYLQVKDKIIGNQYEIMYNGHIFDFFENVIGKGKKESVQVEEYIVDEIIVRL